VSTLKALLVEDSEDDALLVVRALRNYGLDVDANRVASEEGLRDALADGHWDFAILDHNLPGFGGFEALQILQEHGYDGPMITVSGTIGEETAVEVMRAGAHDYVMKDNLTRLGPAIERGLREAEDRRARRRAQEELRASEERYRTLVETMGDGVSMVDLDQRITYANEALAGLVGHSIDDLAGMHLREIYTEESYLTIRKHLRRRFSEGVSTEYEATLQTRSGQHIPVLIHASPLLEDDGRITGSLAVIKDISERKEAEARIRESEERLRGLFDASPDGIVAADLDMRITDCNATQARISGADSVGEIIGHSVLDFIAEQSRDEVIENFEEIVSTGVQRSVEAVDLDGRQFPIEVSANAILNDAGEPEGVVAIIRDITERREAERELQELAQFRRSIVDQANIWLHVLDRDLNAMVWNPAAAEISGIPAEDVLGGVAFWETLYPDPDVRREMAELAGEIVEDGRVVENYEATITTRGGNERIISWNARRLLGPDDEPMGLLALGRDVTEHKELEQQLRQAVKMEAIGRLAGGIAHDFNNMLTAIMGNVQLIQMRMDEDDENQEMLSEIRVAARRSADMTRQLLAFSRRQAMEPEPVDINAVIERMEPMLERMIGEQIAVLTNLDPDLGTITADASQMDQVIMNLVVNARDAMPGGGTLSIGTSNVYLDEEYAATHADVEPGPYVMLSVRDTGEGMDRETQARIFEPFYSTKSEERGTGLGLATVYGIVNQSGGHIYVYSEPDEGTVFKVYFPRSDEERPAQLEEQNRHDNLSGRETILLVEDEEIVRNLLADVLKHHGHSVVSAASAEEALQMLTSHDEDIDIVVTDVVMPGMNGTELAAKIDEMEPQTPVLFVSGYTDDSAVRDGVVEEGKHYLQKPFAPKKLLRRIRKILDSAD
jgi:PAS domain S-box-containing protein